jgi:putative membrane protein
MPPVPEETLRLHQANERTLLAWIRTGIGVMAFGFAIARFGVFLRQVAALEPTRVHLAHRLGSTWVGVALVVLGTLVNALATLRYSQVRRAIERGEVGAPSATLVIAAGVAATLLGVGMGALLAASIGD